MTLCLLYCLRGCVLVFGVCVSVCLMACVRTVNCRRIVGVSPAEKETDRVEHIVNVFCVMLKHARLCEICMFVYMLHVVGI